MRISDVISPVNESLFEDLGRKNTTGYLLNDLKQIVISYSPFLLPLSSSRANVSQTCRVVRISTFAGFSLVRQISFCHFHLQPTNLSRCGSSWYCQYMMSDWSKIVYYFPLKDFQDNANNASSLDHLPPLYLTSFFSQFQIILLSL